MIKYLFIAALIAVALGTSVSCKKDKVPVIDVVLECEDTISFATQIEPIIVSNCSVSGCHNAASSANGYNLEGHGNISSNADVILTVIRHEGGLSPMPQGGNKLADSLIQQFKCWRDQGKLNN